MKLSNYQKAAQRTSPEGHDRVLNGCLGLIGEAGEVVDCVKKYLFQSGENPELPREPLINEIGDVLWYCAELCTGLEISLGEVLQGIEPFRKDYEGMELPDAAGELAMLALRPFEDRAGDMSASVFKLFQKVNLKRVIACATEILCRYCDCTLEDCLEQNIGKLKKRYPKGFDANRSLHRAE